MNSTGLGLALGKEHWQHERVCLLYMIPYTMRSTCISMQLFSRFSILKQLDNNHSTVSHSHISNHSYALSQIPSSLSIIMEPLQPSSVLIPADQVVAVYDNARHVLTLSAKGSSQPVTSSIRFGRLPWDGGLKFALLGVVLAVQGPPQPYEVSDKFNIDIGGPAISSPNLIVETEGKQWIVPIHGLGLQPQPLTEASSAEIASGPSPTELLNTFQFIKVLVEGTFTITQNSTFPNPKDGTVSISYDKTYVALTDAQIRNGLIEYTFTALRPGQTSVDVFVGQSNPPYVARNPIPVSIILPGIGITNATYQVAATFPVGPLDAKLATNGK